MNQHGRGDGQAPKGSGTATAHGQAARQGTAATHAGRKPGEGIQPFIVPHQPSEETPALAGTLPSGSGGPEMEDPGQGTPERLPRDAVCTESALLQVTCYKQDTTYLPKRVSHSLKPKKKKKRRQHREAFLASALPALRCTARGSARPRPPGQMDGPHVGASRTGAGAEQGS